MKHIFVIAAALLLTGCSTASEQVTTADPESAPTASALTVSAECSNAVETVAQMWGPDIDTADPAITTSSQACNSVEEFLSAAHASPDFTGIYENTDAWKDNILLISVCEQNATQSTCLDAADQGILG